MTPAEARRRIASERLRYEAHGGKSWPTMRVKDSYRSTSLAAMVAQATAEADAQERKARTGSVLTEAERRANEEFREQLRADREAGIVPGEWAAQDEIERARGESVAARRRARR